MVYNLIYIFFTKNKTISKIDRKTGNSREIIVTEKLLTMPTLACNSSIFSN